jgi:hypothetical protein
MQEFLLRRTFHFFKKQVFWECCQAAACESFRDDVPEEHHILFCGVKKPVTLATWSSIVSRYSRCVLTKTKDRLVAIARLAKLIHAQTKDQYVAGMWRKMLERDLRWLALNTSPEVQSYVTPSWSWASVLGGVYYPVHNMSPANGPPR